MTNYTEATFAGPLFRHRTSQGLVATYYSASQTEHEDRGKQRRALETIAGDLPAGTCVTFSMTSRQHVRALFDTIDFPWVTLAQILRDHWPFIDLRPVPGDVSAALVCLVEYLDGTGEHARMYVCDRWRARRRWNDLPKAFRQHVWDLALRGELAPHLPALD